MPSTSATRQRRFWLTSTFLIPIVSLGISGAQAQQAPSEQLPPIEVTSPTDPNRTRAKPTYDEASTSRRVAPRTSSRPDPNAVPAPGPAADSFSTGVGAVRQFNGIVGTSTAVITAQDIARSPASTVQEIVAQTPGV